jgi:hypothetical protein
LDSHIDEAKAATNGRGVRIRLCAIATSSRPLPSLLGSPTFINMLLDAWAAALGQPAFVTSTCAELTGVPPWAFLEWATDHAAEFRT